MPPSFPIRKSSTFHHNPLQWASRPFFGVYLPADLHEAYLLAAMPLPEAVTPWPHCPCSSGLSWHPVHWMESEGSLQCQRASRQLSWPPYPTRTAENVPNSPSLSLSSSTSPEPLSWKLRTEQPSLAEVNCPHSWPGSLWPRTTPHKAFDCKDCSKNTSIWVLSRRTP
jgi:hypothetical protein